MNQTEKFGPVDLEAYRRERAQVALTTNETSSGDGSGPHMPDMPDERLPRLEGVVEGLKHGQTQLLVSIGVVAAFVVGFGIYTLQRIDQATDRVEKLSDKVNALPGQINGDIRALVNVIAESITATRQQQPPQIIVVPIPPQQPPEPKQ